MYHYSNFFNLQIIPICDVGIQCHNVVHLLCYYVYVAEGIGEGEGNQGNAHSSAMID